MYRRHERPSIRRIEKGSRRGEMEASLELRIKRGSGPLLNGTRV